MLIGKGSGILPQCAAVLTLAAAVTVGSTSIAGTTVVFEQPLLSGIANNFFVAHVTKAGMPTGVFDLVALQPDPQTSNGYLVPNAWDAGSQTGFVPLSPLTAQLGFNIRPGASTAQMEGDTVGAYLNSKDLPTTRTNQLMMISPSYRFRPGTAPVPYASSTSLLNGEMDLQIPMAVGRDTYVSADLVFLDPAGVRISFSINLFHNGAAHLFLTSTYDLAENIYILELPLAQGQLFVTPVLGSAVQTGTPWLGFRHFQWTLSQAQFVGALKYLIAKYPGRITSTDPTRYVLNEIHLNAEFHYSPTPAELGWSMRGLKVWTTY
jgi:hypothetical protein